MIQVFGSVNLDLIGKVSRIPHPGETVPGSSFATAPGGKGANQALAAARAGARVRMIGAAGRDSMGDEALTLLKAGGVDLGAVRRLETPQGVAMIFVDDSGENVIGILPGANGEVGAADAERELAAATPNDILVVQQEVPQAGTLRALELARERGMVSIFNTAPFLGDTAEASRPASIVVANETEFALLAGVAPSEAAMLRWAAERGQTILVTLGAGGALAVGRDGDVIRVAALPITPVDTVGAGDTFVGYLAAGLDRGMALEPAMQRAAVAASLACLKPGAQPAIPLAHEVDVAIGV
ncbi:MAG: ribokinase [Devosia sp.]